MKQLYNFESKNPPPLSESMLRTELAKRQLHRQTTITAIAGILTQVALLLCAFLLADISPFLAVCCIIYVILSATGGTVIAIIMHSRTGRQALHHA